MISVAGVKTFCLCSGDLYCMIFFGSHGVDWHLLYRSTEKTTEPLNLPSMSDLFLVGFSVPRLSPSASSEY